ncbi:MAG: hypothetical protein ACLFU7_10645 [Armatimonadota bacterium]
MVVVLNLLMALVVALVFAAILVYGFARRAPGPMAGFLFFAFILFFAVWAGAVWITPIGPEMWGVPWVTMVLVGLIIAMIIAAVAAPVPPEPTAPDREGIAPPASAGWGCGLLFWLTIAVLLVAAVARYTWFVTPIAEQ